MEQIPEANRGEMIDFIRGCRCRGFTGHTGNFATMTIEEVRAVFAAAWAWHTANPERPPREDPSPMGALGAAYAADYARQRGRVSECCDAPVVFNNATGDDVCGLCRDRVHRPSGMFKPGQFGRDGR